MGDIGILEIVAATYGRNLEVFLSWMSIFAGISAVGAVMVVGIMMIVGRRNRSQVAAKALSSLPYIVIGLLMVSLSTQFASVVIN